MNTWTQSGQGSRTCLLHSQRSQAFCQAAGTEGPERLVHEHTQSFYCLTAQAPWTGRQLSRRPTVNQNHSERHHGRSSQSHRPSRHAHGV